MLEIVLNFIDRVIPEGVFLVAGESYGGYLTRGVVSKIKESFLIKLQKEAYPFRNELVDSLEAPTLFLTGRQDASVGYQDAFQILERYPRATFLVLDQAGHNLQIEQVEVFSSMVENWLSKVEEAKR